MQTLAEILHGHALGRGDQICLVMQEPGKPDRSITYRELFDSARHFTAQLDTAGILADEVVILIYQHSFELIAAFWGCVLHGAVPSIMPFLTEKLIPERYRTDLAALISITHPAAIATTEDFELEARSAIREGSSVRAVVTARTAAGANRGGLDATPGKARKPADIVLLQHSSGTTGLQKGVALSNGAVLRQLEAYSQEIGLAREDVIVSWLPLYHDMGLIAGFLLPILMGVRLVIMSPFDWVRAPQRLLLAVSQYRGTLVWLPNFAYNFCAQKIRDRHLEGVDLSSLRAVINCSEPMWVESHEKFFTRFSPYGFRREALATSYAMAENVFAVTQGGIGEAVRVDWVDRAIFQEKKIAQPVAAGETAVAMVSAGRPIRGTQVKVVDEQGRVLPERQVGELAVQSDCMLTGYYNRPEETRKALVEGWYLTGDFGYMADGEVFVSGRKKDLMIIGGKNVYPQDIEAVVNEVEGVHPGRAVAFGVFDEESGTEEAVVVAEIDPDGATDAEKIIAEIESRVTRGTAVALRMVHLVGAKWLVKTSSGKIARSANREKYLAEIRNQGDFQGR